MKKNMKLIAVIKTYEDGCQIQLDFCSRHEIEIYSDPDCPIIFYNKKGIEYKPEELNSIFSFIKERIIKASRKRYKYTIACNYNGDKWDCEYETVVFDGLILLTIGYGHSFISSLQNCTYINEKLNEICGNLK